MPRASGGDSIRSIALISSMAFSLVHFRGPLIKALVAKNIAVYALAADFNEDTRARTAALGAIPVDYSLARAGMNPIRDLFDAAGLRRVLARLAPEISLAHFIKPVIYGSLASWSARIPQRFAMIEGLGYVFMDGIVDSSALRRRILRAMALGFYRIALRLNQKVFFLNDEDAAFFTQKKLVRPEQVARIDGIGVDLELYAPAPPFLDPVTFVLIGRMLREKGVYEFAAAAKIVRERYPHARFVLVGGTDSNPGSIAESELRSWVGQGVLDWTGQVADVHPWLVRASVFVLPSYREGMPRSSQEAMAMARPVITTDAVGCRDTVEDGVNGWLVPVRDASALAQAMCRFIESPQLIVSMGNASRRIAESRFDVHAINLQIITALGL
jgi:glycosyltransferase involved in cell wall biosynthesis